MHYFSADKRSDETLNRDLVILLNKMNNFYDDDEEDKGDRDNDDILPEDTTESDYSDPIFVQRSLHIDWEKTWVELQMNEEKLRVIDAAYF